MTNLLLQQPRLHGSIELAMRSFRPEHFSTSEVVLHTCGPTQTVAKYVPYRLSIKYLFVLRGENKIQLLEIYINLTLILALRTVIDSFEILPIDGR